MNVDPFWIEWMAKIAGLFTSLGVIYKVLWKPFKKHFVGRMGEFYDKVNYITSELKPDSKGSLRGQVDYMTSLIEKLDRRQSNFFQFDPHGIFEMDKTGSCIWVNRAYLGISKRHPDEVVGMGWRNTVSERDRERVSKEWQGAIADGRDLFLKLSMVDKDGTEIPVEMRALAMHDFKGGLIGYLGFVSRLDEAPLGCRWCQDLGLQTEDLLRVLEQRRQKAAK